jgi:hypothetical protein
MTFALLALLAAGILWTALRVLTRWWLPAGAVARLDRGAARGLGWLGNLVFVAAAGFLIYLAIS